MLCYCLRASASWDMLIGLSSSFSNIVSLVGFAMVEKKR